MAEEIKKEDKKKKGIPKCPDNYQEAIKWYDDRIANAQTKVDDATKSLNKWTKLKQEKEAQKNVEADMKKAKEVLIAQGFNDAQIKNLLKG